VAAYEDLRQKLEDRVTAEMKRGILLHDAKSYAEAIGVYDGVLAEYPDCARAWYEKSFTYYMMGPEFAAKRQETLARCRECDPLYVRAYQGGPGMGAKFMALADADAYANAKKKDLDGLKKFAAAVEKAGIYEYAAPVQWKLVAFDGPENQKGHVRAFLDDLAGVGLEPKDVGFFRGMFKVE